MAISLSNDPDTYARERLQDCVEAITFSIDLCEAIPGRPHVDTLKDILSRFNVELSRYQSKTPKFSFDDLRRA